MGVPRGNDIHVLSRCGRGVLCLPRLWVRIAGRGRVASPPSESTSRRTTRPAIRSTTKVTPMRHADTQIDTVPQANHADQGGDRRR